MESVTNDRIKRLSRKYSLTENQVFEMALTASGIRHGSAKGRGRFVLYKGHDRIPLVLGFNQTSPFYYSKTTIMLEDVALGHANFPNDDSCDAVGVRDDGYRMRFDRKVECKDCNFCDSYVIRSSTVEDAISEAEKFPLKSIDHIAVAPKGLGSDKKLFEYLMAVNRELKAKGFDGRIDYLGKELHSGYSIEDLVKAGKFSWFLPVGPFADETPDMEGSRMKRTIELINFADFLKLDASFIYTIGLDPVKKIDDWITQYYCTTKFHPIINISQSERIPEADDLEYYCSARFAIEKYYSKFNHHPEVYKSYRSPWFNGDL